MEKGFTLIISLYNKVGSIRATLDSVLNNHGNYPFKCIIVDDDSTDGSSEIAEEYDVKYPDIFQYVKIKHHGERTPVYAKNFGIKLTDTEYIGFLDADDEIYPQFIDRGCNFLDEHPEYSLYGNGCVWKMQNDKNEIFGWHQHFINDNVTDFVSYIVNGGLIIHYCANIYKTTLVKQNLFVDVFGEDINFKLRYIYNYPNIYIDNSTVYSMMWNSCSSENMNWNKQRSDKHYIEEYFDILKKQIPDFKYNVEMINNNEFLIKLI